MLVVDMDDPQAWLNEMKSSATPLTVRYYDTQLNMYQKGTAWIAEWHNAAQVGSLATFSVQLQGNGELGAGDGPIWVGDTLLTQFPMVNNVLVTNGSYDEETETLSFN